MKHLQSIFMEFDANCAPSEDLLVRYFYKSLKLLIKLWINKDGRELNGWEELIRNAIRAKLKAKMQLASSRNIDQRCYCGNWPVYTSLNMAFKDSKIEETKPKAQKPKASNSSLCPNQGGNAKTFWQSSEREEKTLEMGETEERY